MTIKRELTGESALHLRIHRTQAALLAERFAERWVEALAADDRISAGYWSRRYEDAAARCVVLGERLRSQGVVPGLGGQT